MLLPNSASAIHGLCPVLYPVIPIDYSNTLRHRLIRSYLLVVIPASSTTPVHTTMLVHRLLRPQKPHPAIVLGAPILIRCLAGTRLTTNLPISITLDDYGPRSQGRGERQRRRATRERKKDRISTSISLDTSHFSIYYVRISKRLRFHTPRRKGSQPNLPRQRVQPSAQLVQSHVKRTTPSA